MAEFKKKYPVGTKVKCTDGTYTIDDYDNGEVYYYAPDGTYCFSKGPLDFSNEKTEEQKQAEKDYKAGKYPTDDYYQQRAMDKYREVTKAYIDGKIDRVPRRADYDNGGPTGVDCDNIIIRYTTKGYACIVFEGYVIYEEMIMPDGRVEFTDGVHTCTAQALMKWCDDRGIEDYYSLSYKQLQQIFGKLDKNSKSLTYNEWSKSDR